MLAAKDKVVMHTCGEAQHYAGKIWTCANAEFTASSGSRVVFLEGFSGYFLVKYLQKVDVSDVYKEGFEDGKQYMWSSIYDPDHNKGNSE